MPCLLEGAFFVLFLVRTKGAGSLRSTCVSKVAEKVRPVGGKILPEAEKIGRRGWREARAAPGKVSL